MNDYSLENARCKRFICSQAMLSFRSVPSVIALNAQNDIEDVKDPLSLPREKRIEIYEFARSYTDKLFVTQGDGVTWVISPSLFPASSLCVVFGFSESAGELRRLVKECAVEEMFEFSKYTEMGRVRISRRLRERAADFGEFCRDVRALFRDMDRLKVCKSVEEQAEVLAEQCYGLSIFTGCPVKVEVLQGALDATDLSLFTAFVLTMLMSARTNSPDRSAVIQVSSKADAAQVSVSFDCNNSLCISREMLEWKAIAADRCMPFYPVESGGKISIELHAYRYDLAAIFGIKQKDIPFCSEAPYGQ